MLNQTVSVLGFASLTTLVVHNWAAIFSMRKAISRVFERINSDTRPGCHRRLPFDQLESGWSRRSFGFVSD